MIRYEYCDLARGSLAEFQAAAVMAMERVGVAPDAIRYFNRRSADGLHYYLAAAEVDDEKGPRDESREPRLH